jgi:hypothetical protein
MAAMAADPKTQEWWTLTEPLQVPSETRAAGEWWTPLTEVFHTDYCRQESNSPEFYSLRSLARALGKTPAWPCWFRLP